MNACLPVYLPVRVKNALQKLAARSLRSASAEARIAIEAHVSAANADRSAKKVVGAK